MKTCITLIALGASMAFAQGPGNAQKKAQLVNLSEKLLIDARKLKNATEQFASQVGNRGAAQLTQLSASIQRTEDQYSRVLASIGGGQGGGVPGGIYAKPWISKWDLDVEDQCQQPGSAIIGVKFKHPLGENYIYQESFSLICSRALRQVRGLFRTGLVSKASIPAKASCSGGYAVGMRFQHPIGRNFTNNESVELVCAAGNVRPRACYDTNWTSKWELETQSTCRQGYLASGISFQHPHGQNETYQESYKLTCCPAI